MEGLSKNEKEKEKEPTDMDNSVVNPGGRGVGGGRRGYGGINGMGKKNMCLKKKQMGECKERPV